MTLVPRACSRCRISSRKAANKALRISWGQMRAKEQQMKARETGRWKLRGSTTLSQLIFKANWKQMNLGAESTEHPGLCCSSPGRWEGKDPSASFSFSSPGGFGRVSAHWTSPCPHKTTFCFVLWLINQSVGRSIDSWQQSSSFLQNVIPLPVLSVLESQPGRYKFKYLIELNI